MTNEECVDICDEILSDIESDLYLKYDNSTNEFFKGNKEFISKCKEANEKQVPVKPVLMMNKCGLIGINYWYCGKCGGELVSTFRVKMNPYCPHCGQKVKIKGVSE